MPLPPALQARLKKRGIVTEEPEVKAPPPENSDVIRKGCPNTSNPFHECSDYCLQRWGAIGKPKMKKKNYKLQPLPPGWFKVPDLETKHEYYWNVHTNKVSWRHPSDPRAEVTYPAAWQKKPEEPKPVAKAIPTNPVGNLKNLKDIPRDEKILKSNLKKVRTGKHPSLMKAQKQKEKFAPYRKGKKDDELDPMDPASYSDVARGNWSSGLKEDQDVKTGVDTTASGPLFQSRPYPNPGAILRRNKGEMPPEEPKNTAGPIME